ncbi:hypothetical protein AJ79_01460 [Helicocarpus griseus UAMH5409]|uniref:Uncharacterized protein n=1 Tax=Helicocarpus griseus UAMH5409 TaxID=1447875 RepID=A0A2B7Y5Q6_9EURO|nr:hypothetical protein AJ79_01460 [Helicocarpus griseus UAMH5409]
MPSSTPLLQGSSIDSSLHGVYTASPIKYMKYGRGSITSLPTLIENLGASKAYIITGRSLREKTPVIERIEGILKEKGAWAGTFSGVREHAPIADIHSATSAIRASGADVLVSVGGGSPIDAAKAVAWHLHREAIAGAGAGADAADIKWVPSIAVPTTLSAAETTRNAGYTNEKGEKVGVAEGEMVPKAVLYDGDIALHTPLRLWLSSGIRALDHALELLYHPSAPEIPTKRLALSALPDLFHLLPASHSCPDDADIRQRLFLAAYAALFPFQFTGALGLSHAIGHAIGASYGIPHGITSCVSLAGVLRYYATKNGEQARQIARAACVIPEIESKGDVVEDALAVAKGVQGLVKVLGLGSWLVDYNVNPGEEEAIAVRALRDPAHPDIRAVTELVRTMYAPSSSNDAATRL